MNSTGPGHTQRQWEGKFFRRGMECYYCRVPLTLSEATKDHLLPQSRGGSDAISNIEPACIDCNQLKGELTEQEFRAERKQFSEAARKLTARSAAESKTVIPKHVQREAEPVSWAWRNPPPPTDQFVELSEAIRRLAIAKRIPPMRVNNREYLQSQKVSLLRSQS
jgi:hypothetical protein